MNFPDLLRDTNFNICWWLIVACFIFKTVVDRISEQGFLILFLC
jgi:hypothetical protein